jgi:hypothetical protein
LNFRAGQDFSILARIKPLPANTPFGVMSIVEKRRIAGIAAALGHSLHLEQGRLACQLAPAARWTLTFASFTSVARIRDAWRRRSQLTAFKFASYASPGPDLRDGQFHHVALTIQRRSRQGGKLHVDGKVVLSFDPTAQASSLANAEPLLIGTHPDPSLNCGFRGLIEDVRLYARVLTAPEIKAAASGSLDSEASQ